MVNRFVVVLLLVGCQGNESAKPAPRRDAKPTPIDVAAEGSASSTGSGSGGGSGSAVVDDNEPVADPGKLIADLGAIPAWQAVVDRGQYLARRNLHGVVYGTLGPSIQMADPASDGGLIASPFTWLIDDTEGNGALAIRIKLGKQTPKQGDRVALAGAWKLDDARHYYWEVDELTALPPAPPSDIKDPPAPPGHTIVDGNLLQGSRTISVAKDNDAVYFMVTGKPPAVDGEGWPVADELGDPVYALLNLPGERPSFGGQDFRTPDERWQLKRGATYTVRIGKVRKHGPDKPATINARTAPIRVN
jgi:hypothetical protein